MAAQLPHGRHHPSHPERRADLFDVAAAARAGADDFLKGNDVRADLAKDRGDAFRPGPAVHPPAAMDVVRHDAERRGRVMLQSDYDSP